MRKNELGFTLIELLAVITIMGILMLVAIPAVTRTIENSRRDTFANTADEYIKAVSNAVSSDELECNVTTADINTLIGAVPAGTYYVNINTAEKMPDNSTDNANLQQTKDLMEQGGKSSWSNADVRGYVKIVKSTQNNRTTYTYSINLVDKGGHGTSNGDTGGEVATPVKRAAISATATASYIPPQTGDTLLKSPTAGDNNVRVCKVS